MRRLARGARAGLARGLQGRSPGHFPSFDKSKPGNTNPNARLTVRHTSTGGRSPPPPDPVVADIYVQDGLSTTCWIWSGNFGDAAAQTARMGAEIADETLRNQS